MTLEKKKRSWEKKACLCLQTYTARRFAASCPFRGGGAKAAIQVTGLALTYHGEINLTSVHRSL